MRTLTLIFGFTLFVFVSHVNAAAIQGESKIASTSFFDGFEGILLINFEDGETCYHEIPSDTFFWPKDKTHIELIYQSDVLRNTAIYRCIEQKIEGYPDSEITYKLLNIKYNQSIQSTADASVD